MGALTGTLPSNAVDALTGALPSNAPPLPSPIYLSFLDVPSKVKLDSGEFGPIPLELVLLI